MTYYLPRDVEKLVLILCEDLGTEVAAALATKLKQGKLREVKDVSCYPQAYDCADSFRVDNLLAKLLAKCDFDSGIDKKGEALATFLSCESRNKVTNSRLRLLREAREDGFVEDLALDGVIERARRFCRNLLGPVPHNVEGRFGPGAVFDTRNGQSAVPDKMSSVLTTTSGAEWWHLLPNGPWMSSTKREVVRGNRFTSVPKTFQTERGICVEPSSNIYFQLGVGAHLKRRIRSYTGIDLSGTEENGRGQFLHRKLLLDDPECEFWATIDLTSASDLVSYEFAKLILPKGWFDVFDSLRCTHTLVNLNHSDSRKAPKKVWMRQEKFSSMGNGFTFELETILFMAIGAGIGLKPGIDMYVYGDDIILLKESFDDMCEGLKFFGLVPNPKKSFREGRFRESCGMDTFDGQPVRAYYLKELPYEPQHWIRIANGLLRWVRTFPKDRFFLIERAWHYCLQQLPSAIRGCFGPTWFGDIFIHHPSDEWNIRRRNTGLAYAKAYVPVTRSLDWNRYSGETQLWSALYGCWDSPGGESQPRLVGRDLPTKGYRLQWLPIGI